MLTALSLLLYSSTNSSFPPSGPRNLISLITMPLPPPPSAAPVPVKGTAARPPPVLVMFSVAFLPPAVVGRKTSDAVVEAPAARAVVAGAPTVNCGASAPVMGNGVLSVTVPPLVLVIVTEAAPIEPVVTEPKSIDGGATVSTPVTVTENAAEPV